LVNLFFVWFFTSFCPNAVAAGKHKWIFLFYDFDTNPIVYVVAANLIQCIVTLFLLSGEIKSVPLKFNGKLWREMMIYSLPLVIVGLGGVVNETFDRIMLHAWLPGSLQYKDEQVGIYNACYKLSILITLFIQAFRMGAEPFFFKQAEEEKMPQRTYARVMKFFVITITGMFLVVVLYLPVWQNLIGPKYRVGLSVVPILLLANMFLGIYYNLAIWYKLSNKTIAGTYITLIGTGITVIINYLFVPHFGYMAGAWGTFTCYLTMMILSFVWGQKEYPIPYAWKKLIAYIVVVVLLFFIHKAFVYFLPNIYLDLLLGTLLLLLYGWFIFSVERKEFKKLPVIGKYVR
jgi:O-antigen/teichoic acid export membrane protein